jgi:ubiquinone biosynthesis monooxygenase Coq7
MVDKKKIKEILRVNHAGEYGACQIYKGQMAVLGKNDDKILHMKEQEEEHLKRFTKIMIENKVAPTLFQPLWHVLGFAIGAGSALLGKKYAHACTIAIEEVIDEHYQSQLDEMEGKHNQESNIQDIKDLIKKCQAEEIEHMNISANEGGKEIKGYKIFSQIIKTGARVAIAISKKI